MILLLLFYFVFSSDIYLYDLTYTEDLDAKDAYEHVHLITAVSGLVNREGPNFYVNYIKMDETWLEYLKKNWLKDKNFDTLKTIEAVVDKFKDSYKGVVLYDPKVYSTALVASSVAGIDNLLPICYRDEKDSLYQKLVSGGPKLKVVVNLVDKFNGSITGSCKNDAYRWLIDEYIKKGKVNPLQVGYYLDYFWTTVSAHPYNMHTVSNQDFVISEKGIFFDLFFWDDETPNDDPHQPLGTDLKTVKLLLESIYNQTNGEQMIQVNGFTPWRFKYITGKHEGVETEWETVKIISSYNMFVDADACCIGSMTNAAFYRFYPLKERYIQNGSPTKDSLTKKGFIDDKGKVNPFMYISYYVGDYDSSAWFYSQLLPKWQDQNRGKVPLGWAPNPILSKRFPILFDIMFSELTENDYITTGDSGNGYINPTEFFTPRYSGLPDGTSAWKKHCVEYYNKFNLKFTGFIIQGRSGKMTEKAEKMYNEFSYDGGTLQQGYQPEGKDPVHLMDNSPYFYEIDISHDPHTAATSINNVRKSGTVQFNVFRAILQTPSWFLSIQDFLLKDVKVVTPIELSYLARLHLGGNNDNRITFISDTIPTNVKKETVSVKIEVRNEGWNELVAEKMKISFKIDSKEQEIDCKDSIPSGATSTCEGNIDFQKVKTGQNEISYNLVYDGESFSKYGNLDWKTIVNVE